MDLVEEVLLVDLVVVAVYHNLEVREYIQVQHILVPQDKAMMVV